MRILVGLADLAGVLSIRDQGSTRVPPFALDFRTRSRHALPAAIGLDLHGESLGHAIWLPVRALCVREVLEAMAKALGLDEGKRFDQILAGYPNARIGGSRRPKFLFLVLVESGLDVVSGSTLPSCDFEAQR